MTTLLNFENYFRQAKVDKAREIFNKGQVLELRKAKKMWMATMKTGLYKVQLNLIGLEVGHGTCTCNNSYSRSGYCDHKVALMFALRKELDVYTPLTNSVQKLNSTNTAALKKLAASINDMNRTHSLSDLRDFIKISNELLDAAERQIENAEQKDVISDCIEVIKLTAKAARWFEKIADSEVEDYDYDEHDDDDDDIEEIEEDLEDDNEDDDQPDPRDEKNIEEIYDRAFQCIKDAVESTRDEEMLEALAYDLRVEVLRNYKDNLRFYNEWISILKSISKNGNRKDKYEKVMQAIDRFDKEFPETL